MGRGRGPTGVGGGQARMKGFGQNMLYMYESVTWNPLHQIIDICYQEPRLRHHAERAWNTLSLRTRNCTEEEAERGRAGVMEDTRRAKQGFHELTETAAASTGPCIHDPAYTLQLLA